MGIDNVMLQNMFKFQENIIVRLNTPQECSIYYELISAVKPYTGV